MSVLADTAGLDVVGYAAAVRRSLVGLSQDQVDDLTDGLEADLADALADERHVAHGRELVEQFGAPEAYAAELRAAAGLPAAGDARARRPLDPVRRSREVGTRVLGRLRAQAWWPPAEAFLVSLRPVWWVFRAWLVLQLATAWVLGDRRMSWLPNAFAEWVVLGGLVVLSVQWGRGVWFQSRSTRWLPVLANVVVVLALLPVLATMSHRSSQVEDVYRAWAAGAFNGGVQTVYQDKPVDGVVVDGIQVSNLFVYDAQGDPLQDVQIYDDRGLPVRTTFDDGYDQFWFPGSTEPWSFVPAADVGGQARWNVYPLRGAPTSQFEYDGGSPALQVGTSAGTPPWPFAKAPALVGRGTVPADPAEGTVSASGDQTAGATPTPSGTTGPTAGPTAAPTP
ncbi:hypothetical protein Cch01nite_03750 [Cellulomonas chitinilytica]|uniref:Uncharacterized protein n=1 Tax=Cellulomonas chitinilytica TaxID=398759 RepID=A0A919P0Y9_9CELL|nr:hypothetical protein [Cellulomonas chitinilytica]GIG19651.1 hypothetical protein Cch01nite_03750 [Cellulomonas chitinilytica]